MNLFAQLRKITAAALFAVLCLAMLQPVFALTPAKTLPACCRANGKHKCSMGGHDNSPAFRASPCAEYPTATAPSILPEVAALAVTNTHSHSAPSAFTKVLATAPLRSTEHVGNTLLRGPPVWSQSLSH